MCMERFLAECPYGSTVELDGVLYQLVHDRNPDSISLKNKATGEVITKPDDTIVISHYLSKADVLRLYKAGKDTHPPCNVPYSAYGDNE